MSTTGELSTVERDRILFGDGGQLRFNRVMAGEYRCDLSQGTYCIDHVWVGCDCSGSMMWQLSWHYGYRRWDELGNHRTLTDAKLVAASDYKKKGAVSE